MLRYPLCFIASHACFLEASFALLLTLGNGKCQEHGGSPAHSADLSPFEASLAGECGLWTADCDHNAGDEGYPTQYVSLLQHWSGKQRAAQGPVIEITQQWAGAKAKTICMYEHALPQLYLLGPQKSGTTTVANDLFTGGVKDAQHGKHCDDSACKELHTFDSICGYDVNRSTPRDGSSRCAVMTPVQKQEWAQQFQSCTSENAQDALLADMTPANLRLLDLAPMLADLYGESKSSLRFVILLRNPVERMHSGFHFPHANPNFSTWLRDVVIRRAEGFHATGSVAGIETDADMDQFYRSLMSVQLKPWLDVFHPSQFMLVPMSMYFVNAEFRQQVFRQMTEQWDIILREPPLDEQLAYDNQGSHPSLEQDAEPALIEELNSKFFYPDAVNLANLLSNTIPLGLNLVGYTGPPNSASEIGKFLQSMNYPLTAP